MSTVNLILEEDITNKEIASMDANSGRAHICRQKVISTVESVSKSAACPTSPASPNGLDL